MTPAYPQEGRTRALWLATLMVFSAAFAQAACIPLLPTQLAHAGVGYLEIGAIMSASTLGAISFRVLAARNLYRAGAASWLSAGLATIALAVALYALDAPPPLTALFRFAQGLGFGAVTIASMVWAAGAFPPERRATAFAVVGAAIGSGVLVGPVAALAIAQATSGPIAYLCIAGLALLGAACPFPRGNKNAPPASSGSSGLTPSIAAAVVACGLASALIGLMEAFTPIMAGRNGVHGLGLIIGGFGIASVLGRFLLAALTGKVGVDASLSLASLAAALAAVAAIWSMHNTATAILVAVLLGLAVGATINAAMTFASFHSPPAAQVSVLGAMGIVADAGLGLGAVLGGASMSLAGGWGPGLTVLAAALATIALATALARRRVPALPTS
ncbi:MAG: MFS transporter [Phenylobacterium sp.]|jgi:MFS family permease|uniref:MFS transporter n=1 Tax=Phenylobacterium sp. TaxID=1871053 RepID=UPI0025CC937E|nr:MFS transporter [Phenylobacterium sp.]MCA3710591.1 MFS transporter [Phenylobacterium sp.]